VDPEDVVHVLRNMVEAVDAGGVVLDLQVIRPNPIVEIGGRAFCEINGDPLFLKADAATAAVDDLVRAEWLLEEATDDHDVRKHYENGAELVDDFADKTRTLPAWAVTDLRETAQPCVIRERCRLRRLRLNQRELKAIGSRNDLT
jgi:hypothetical protein